MKKERKREHWKGQMMFVMAAAGSAIGLGNIWKYPYIAGENGGAAFTIIYIFCVAVIGLPLIISEILIGRASQKDPVGAYRALSKPGSKWWLAGLLGVVSGFIILSFYSVVAGWALAYTFKAMLGEFTSLINAEIASTAFAHFSADPVFPIIWHGIFMALCVWIVIKGIKKGLEKYNSILMPILVGILLLLVLRSITLPGASKGIKFLWYPDFSKINAEAILLALGHAFFTLSIGMGVMITYGSYLRPKSNVSKAGFLTALTDTAIALLAGLAIFPAVFAFNGNPADVPGLIFVTLPVVFNYMPLGAFFGFSFFAFLTIAALTSAISILETVTAYMIDEWQWGRKKATLLMGALIFAFGVPCSLSFSTLSGLTLAGMTFFDWMDYLSSNIFLPLGGFLLAIFIGWSWKRTQVIREFKTGNKLHRTIFWWFMAIRYVIPILVLIIFIAKFFGY